MSNKLNITAVVLTKNESFQIRRCLDSVKDWVSEIIIIDDQSIDQTTAIAQKEYAAKVVIQASDNCLAQQRNAGIDAASQEWVLQMDADEVFLPSTAAAIAQALSAPGANAGYYLLRKDCVFGHPLDHVGNSYQLKLFKRSLGRYTGMIHETLDIKGPSTKIEAVVLHYSIPSISTIIARHNLYTEVEAVKYLKERPALEVNMVKREVLYKPFKLFFKHYVRHKGYKDGVNGLVWSLVHTMYPVILLLKVIELLQTKKGKSDAC